MFPLGWVSGEKLLGGAALVRGERRRCGGRRKASVCDRVSAPEGVKDRVFLFLLL